MESRSWSSSFLDWGKVDSDTEKNLFQRFWYIILVLSRIDGKSVCDERVFMQYVIPELHYYTAYLQYSKNP